MTDNGQLTLSQQSKTSGTNDNALVTKALKRKIVLEEGDKCQYLWWVTGLLSKTLETGPPSWTNSMLCMVSRLLTLGDKWRMARSYVTWSYVICNVEFDENARSEK